MDEFKDNHLAAIRRIDDFQLKLDELEQSQKENLLEITGIPRREKEDVFGVIKSIGDVIGFAVDDHMLSDYYRTRPNPTTNFPGVIVVEFVRKVDKRAFFQAAWKKRDLSIRALGFLDGEDSRIYVNNFLTFNNRKLLNAAKEFKKQHGYRFLWSKNGKIFLRKAEGDQHVLVRSCATLQELSKSESMKKKG